MKSILIAISVIFTSYSVIADQLPCPDLRGQFVCPPSSNHGVELTLNISQAEQERNTVYTYQYVSAEGTKVATYTASSDGYTNADNSHLFCHNDTLYCDLPGNGRNHATNYYFIDSDSGNYIAGRIGKNPITCIRK